ncbi:MAG: hypothetical protein IJS93_00790 [Clostridia bacterium]|nr:hypothetical protein [Clostridia bacterium]
MLAQYVETERNETTGNIAAQNVAAQNVAANRKQVDVVNVVRVECRQYDTMATTTPALVKERLWNCLTNGVELTNRKTGETVFDIVEELRFERMKEIIKTMHLNNLKRIEEARNPVETHKVLKRSRIPILAAYALMVVVIVAALIAVVPGTSWEVKRSVNLQANPVMSVSASNTSVAVNTIMTEEGPVEVELTPYAEDEVIETNWFDRFCDKVSKVFGG